MKRISLTAATIIVALLLAVPCLAGDVETPGKSAPPQSPPASQGSALQASVALLILEIISVTKH